MVAEQRFSKKDWVLFREKLPGWQEAYMDMLNKEYINILSSEGSPSEKFWRLDKRIKEDRRSPGVQLRLSRTDMVYEIAGLIKEGVICLCDLEEFSGELQETVHALLE